MTKPKFLPSRDERGILQNMSTVEELEAAVQRLSPEDRAVFRAWFAEFDAAEWDRQFEDDVTAGRLDWLVAEARQDRDTGRCTDR
ncbi:MAG: hypothetical protein WD894_15545 [Pirellulales bacterium]